MHLGNSCLKMNRGKMKGLIISNISNLYRVKVEDRIIECNVRGKIK